MIRKFLQRASNIAHSLGHFGRLGKVAATRSFLKKERRKLLVKLGERTVRWLEEHPGSSPDLQQAVAQILKIDDLLSREDYGGGAGVDFTGKSPQKSPKKSARPKGRRREEL